MEPITDLNDITADKLDEVAWEWEENRIHNLVRESVMNLGSQLRKSRMETNHLEVRSKIRALQLHNQHGMDVKEIAWLFGLEVKEIRRWLR